MSRNVLLVEDEWLQAENLETLLRLEGFAVCGSVRTGEDAIRLAKIARPDLALIDVELGGAIDGVHTAQAIAGLCSCKIVFVTAHSDAKTRERMTQLKPSAILIKPTTAIAVIAALKQAADAETR